jgi:hypothetical protein
VAVAQASGTGLLDRDDALIASKYIDNDGVRAYRQLLQDHLLRETSGRVGARHRVIAEGVAHYFRAQDQLKIWVLDLLYLFGMRYEPNNMTRGRYGRLLIRFLNHDFLMSMVVSSPSVSWIYENLEDLLSTEFHYWLQRGSFETTHGDWLRAETFLAQARAMKADDIRADTAWFYLQLLRGIDRPRDPLAVVGAKAALDGLYAILREQPKNSPHTYDIFLGSGLTWYRAASLDRVEKLELRDRLVEQARVATYLYPNNQRIRNSAQSVNRTLTIVI